MFRIKSLKAYFSTPSITAQAVPTPGSTSLSASFMALISDDTVSGILPATKPATWDSAYAIANSPYKIWDTTNNEYRALTTADADPADWTVYANLSYIYTPTT